MPVRRKPIPLAVKVAVLERTLCGLLCCDKIEYDHRPPLYLRERINDGCIPFENDPAYIEAIPKQEHAKRTHGTAATSYGSDAHERAKTKRLAQRFFDATTRLVQAEEAIRRSRSRPLPGGRNSPLKKTIAGKVVRRSKP